MSFNIRTCLAIARQNLDPDGLRTCRANAWQNLDPDGLRTCRAIARQNLDPDGLRKKRGFTLIELLVVIAIIALLTTIALVALGPSRAKARDSAIKASMGGIRTAAALDYDDTGNYNAVCNDEAGGEGILSTSGNFGRIKTVVETQNGSRPVVCNETAIKDAYAVYSVLVSDSSGVFCVDSAGAAKRIANTATSAQMTVCP